MKNQTPIVWKRQYRKEVYADGSVYYYASVTFGISVLFGLLRIPKTYYLCFGANPESSRLSEYSYFELPISDLEEAKTELDAAIEKWQKKRLRSTLVSSCTINS